jgi:hypothetical protein
LTRATLATFGVDLTMSKNGLNANVCKENPHFGSPDDSKKKF